VYLGAKRRYINTLPFLFPFPMAVSRCLRLSNMVMDCHMRSFSHIARRGPYEHHHHTVVAVSCKLQSV